MLQTPIGYLKSVGGTKAQLLQSQLGIYTYQDLLHFFPSRYIDKTRFYKIHELYNNNSEVQLVGEISNLKVINSKGKKRLTAIFNDGTGQIQLVWYARIDWISQQIEIRKPYVIFGKIKSYQGLSMAHPEMELLEKYQKKQGVGFRAIYPSTTKLSNKGISSKVISNMMLYLFEQMKWKFEENLCIAMMQEIKLMPRHEALRHIHFPKDQESLSKAQFRLKFEELFFIQLQLIRKKLVNKHKIKGYAFDTVGHYFNTFYTQKLPFELTKAQKKVLREIRNDVGQNAQMNRLLQGDVGSGKTIVALLSMLIAIDNGFQCCMIAPTAILAQQHYDGICELLHDFPINCKLLMGSTRSKARKLLHQELESGDLQILIGTHAVLEDKVIFKNLGLAIIDEQHRFGVAQRAKLWKKNQYAPHVLIMTATPIPRTLAMSVYGDLDVSVIDQLPKGRKPIKTVHRYDNNRLQIFKFIKDEIQKGRQAYIVYPLIEESATLDYKDLMDGYESISREFPKPDYQIAIVHGKMKPQDKAYEMERFTKGEAQILVATTVIEVGVNVPNASIMVIENAERFGLSQLHQLRGRVGRGSQQSYCVLMTSFKLSSDGKTRMETMVKSTDGFEIAQVDLKLRGPGDIMGTRQSGTLDLKIADAVKDTPIMQLARYWAIQITNADPNLEAEENQMIKNTYQAISKHKNIWNYIS